MQFPPEFEIRMKSQLGHEWKDFALAHDEPPVTSVLLNSAKLPAIPFPSSTQTGWCPHGFYLDSRPVFTLEPLFHGGGFYVMEASSMILWHVLKYCLPQKAGGRKILDLCAAPGGKTLVTSQVMQDNDLLLSNEVHPKRYAVLRENITKWGYPNIWSLRADPSNIPLDNYFDCVIVDAPCSGEGLFRKDSESLQHWSPENSHHCSLRQTRILHEADRLLAPGGILVYSTCTYASNENIDHINTLIETGRYSSVHPDPPPALLINIADRQRSTAYQLYPHKVRGEGFFIAAMRKDGNNAQQTDVRRTRKSQIMAPSTKPPSGLRDLLRNSDQYSFFQHKSGDWYAIPRQLKPDLDHLRGAMPGLSAGVFVGQMKGRDLVPSHEIALCIDSNPEIQALEIDKSQALRYLRRESLSNADARDGWNLIRYEGVNLGWAKKIANGLKNYYPMRYRIRMAAE